MQYTAFQTRRRFLSALAGGTMTAAAYGVSASSRIEDTMDHTSPGSKPASGYVYDDRYLEHRIHRGHPESPDRLRAIKRRLDKTGLREKLHQIEPIQAPLPHVERIHSPAHIAQIKEMGTTGEIARLAVAGAVAATKAVCEGNVRNAFCAIRPPGHHALNTGREEGFCYYNNIAVAARYAQAVHGVERVLIADWDFHHGNGTEWAFYEDPSVMFFSTHNRRAYPGTGDPSRTGKGPGKGYNINVHLGCGADDEEMITTWRENLLPAVSRFKPQLVLVSAGFDSRRDDLLGCFDVTDLGFIKLTRLVMDIAAEHCEGRLATMLEGGYNVEGLSSAVEMHVQTLLQYNP